MERYKHLKETLMCAVEGQCMNLTQADTKELGEAIDMLKDLEEAMYYAAITKAMKADEQEQEGKYYHPISQADRMYYNGRDMTRGYTEYASGNGGTMSYTDGMRGYTDYNRYNDGGMNYTRDQREGRSGMSRRSYMEGKEMRKDKQSQMRELEKYMQELTSDMVEMIDHASPEEKQYLEKKLAALSQKIGQIND